VKYVIQRNDEGRQQGHTEPTWRFGPGIKIVLKRSPQINEIYDI